MLAENALWATRAALESAAACHPLKLPVLRHASVVPIASAQIAKLVVVPK